MKKTEPLQNLKNKIETLSQTEQKDIKGGILFYCEEKRRGFLGMNLPGEQWSIAYDGSPWLTIRM